MRRVMIRLSDDEFAELERRSVARGTNTAQQATRYVAGAVTDESRQPVTYPHTWVAPAGVEVKVNRSSMSITFPGAHQSTFPLPTMGSPARRALADAVLGADGADGADGAVHIRVTDSGGVEQLVDRLLTEALYRRNPDDRGLISAESPDDVRRVGKKLYEAYAEILADQNEFPSPWRSLSDGTRRRWDAVAKRAIEYLARWINVPAGTKITTSEDHAQLTRKLRVLAANLDARARTANNTDQAAELHHIAEGLRGLVTGDDIEPLTEVHERFRQRDAKAFELAAEILSLPSKHEDAIAELDNVRKRVHQGEDSPTAAIYKILNHLRGLYRTTGNHSDVIDRLDRLHPIEPIAEPDTEFHHEPHPDVVGYTPLSVPLQHPPEPWSDPDHDVKADIAAGRAVPHDADIPLYPAGEENDGRCRCGRLAVDDAPGCQWHDAVRLHRIQRLETALRNPTS